MCPKVFKGKIKRYVCDSKEITNKSKQDIKSGIKNE